MIDFFCIFTTGGLILWSKAFVSENLTNLINDLIKTIIMDEKKHQDYYIPVKGNGIILRWKIINESGLIFVVAYQESFNVLYTDKLLDLVMKDFITNQLPLLKHDKNIFYSLPDKNEYNKAFIVILNKWENYCKNEVYQRANSSKKTDNNINDNSLKLKNSASSSTQLPSSLPGIGGHNFVLRRKNNDSKKKIEKNPKKTQKNNRVWDDGTIEKVNEKTMDKYDQSKDKQDNKKNDKQVQQFKEKFLGPADPDNLDETNFDDIDQKPAKSKGIFSRFTSALKNYIGNKILTEEDLKPVMDDLINLLLEKNVAKEIAEQLCESVKKGLLNTKTNSFTTISTTVKEALKESIAKILTPKEELDLLRNALAAKKRGEPYKIVFIGVNGVGKSTNLAKVGYMLMNNGLKISIAACDNFRSGAIEQLKTHTKALGCHLFEKGYKDDPAYIAKEAIDEAKKEGYDCVLIDTAGRMQDNEPLMKSLAKLVDINQPDAILFVGEALTGNDSVDQLTKFNQALIDNSKKNNPRTIDGILLTKFDTVDDKVGSALTMVYTTGKPIVYVGTGQKYINLKKLNVNNVLNALFG